MGKVQCPESVILSKGEAKKSTLSKTAMDWNFKQSAMTLGNDVTELRDIRHVNFCLSRGVGINKN